MPISSVFHAGVPRRMHLALPLSHVPNRACNRKQIVRQQTRALRAQNDEGNALADSNEATDENLRCWSNGFTGRVLTPISQQMWGMERRFEIGGLDFGGRGVVVRLNDGNLWVMSPVDLTPELRQQLDTIGPVKHIVASNYEHTRYVRQWKEAYPDATVWGCPGMKETRPTAGCDAEIGMDNAVPTTWLGEFEATHLNYERIPLFSNIYLNEVIQGRISARRISGRKNYLRQVVFVHLPSRTLVVTDLWWNYPSGGSLGLKLVKQGWEKICMRAKPFRGPLLGTPSVLPSLTDKPLYFRTFIEDEEKYTAAAHRILNGDWDSMVPCHGTVLTSGGKEALSQHLNQPARRLIRR